MLPCLLNSSLATLTQPAPDVSEETIPVPVVSDLIFSVSHSNLSLCKKTCCPAELNTPPQVPDLTPLHPSDVVVDPPVVVLEEDVLLDGLITDSTAFLVVSAILFTVLFAILQACNHLSELKEA